jgi:hypothetical protein
MATMTNSRKQVEDCRASNRRVGSRTNRLIAPCVVPPSIGLATDLGRRCAGAFLFPVKGMSQL